MLYDLNVPWSVNGNADLQRTIAFQDECMCTHSEVNSVTDLPQVGYNVLALTHTITGTAPSTISNAIPHTLPFSVPASITLLRRCTLSMSDPTLNHRMSQLAAAYDILALRPTTERAFLAACTTLSEHSLISLDLTVRHPFHFRPKPFSTAIARGIKFEICYAQALEGDREQRKNFVSNVTAIVRATRGRGLVLSGEAGRAVCIRAPADVLNLLSVWGVGRERGVEAMGVNPRSVVVNEGIKRRGFRGVIDVVNGGERPAEDVARDEPKKAEMTKKQGSGPGKNGGASKRKAEAGPKGEQGGEQISKRQAKKMRLEAMKAEKTQSAGGVPTDATDASGLDNKSTKTLVNG